MGFSFKVNKKSSKSKARTAVFKTPHGQLETPAFMPVGTVGAVKTVSAIEMPELSEGLILGNTYHLYLRPGLDIIEKAGGLHKFMNWNGSILTDSGGFQVFSLSNLNKISDSGVEFSSHIDGSKHFFTPEKSIEIQRILASDIMMAFDECVPFPSEDSYVKKSLKRTHAWAKRCWNYYQERCDTDKQALFPIIQGGMNPTLRKQSVDELCSLDAVGFGIGGLSVGESRDIMGEVLSETTIQMPNEKPRYLMGVGTPEDFEMAVRMGVDLFDCVMPTRVARHGSAYTDEGRLNIKAARFKDDFNPIEKHCPCFACQHHTRAYIRHLLKVQEPLALRLLTYHNLSYFKRFMKRLRQKINTGEF